MGDLYTVNTSMLRTFRSRLPSKPRVWERLVRSDNSRADFTVPQALQVFGTRIPAAHLHELGTVPAYLHPNMRMESAMAATDRIGAYIE